MDSAELKRHATGRWREILTRVGGCSEELLDRRNHPCPKCGGSDRFRLIDEDDGAVLCNQCFKTGNGDGIAAIQWLCNVDFRESVDLIAGYLGVNGTPRKQRPLIEEIAQRKRMPLESFKLFGAFEAMHGKLPVVRVPMYGHDGAECSYCDFATIDERWLKGVSAKDMPAGIYWVGRPEPGDTVLITEGVKDAAALHGQGWQAVGLSTNEMSAKFAHLFAECDVIIVPDRDKAGEAGAKATASRLIGIAASVKIAILPTEYKENHGDGVREVLAKRQGPILLKLAIERAIPWKPDGTTGSEFRITTVAEAAQQYLTQLEKGPVAMCLSGLRAIDNSIEGVAFGEMCIIAARPSHGKTMLALQWLDNAALNGFKGLIVSEEMSSLALGRRAVEYVSEVAEYRWQSELDEVREEVRQHYAERPSPWIAESVGTVDRAVEVIEQQIAENDVKVVAVDYATLLRGVGATKYEQITYVSMCLKKCAAKNNIALLLLCQMSRNIEQRKEKTPMLSDLRDSGSLEQDADVVLFLQWPYKDDPTYTPKNEYRVYVAKNRNRRIREPIVVLSFEPSRQKLLGNQADYEDPFDNRSSSGPQVANWTPEF